MKQIRKNKIKIIRIITRLNIGGPAIHTILLTEGLNSGPFETHLVIGKPEASEGDIAGLAREKNLNVEYIPELKRDIGLHDIVAFFKIFRFVMKIRPDIVHTHTAKAGALGRLAAILTGVPIKIHTFHGHVLDQYFSPFKARFFAFIERILGYFTDKVIVVSEAVRDELVNKFRIIPKEKCDVIKLGLDLDKFLEDKPLRGNFRKKINAGSGDFLVGIVGRLVPIKNHRMFLDTARQIKDSAPELKTKFLVIGDGEMKNSLQSYAKNLGLNNKVLFTGWVEDLAGVYADLDVVALTSLNEGTPVSLIEAMASAKAVVATDVGGVRDLVRNDENGFLAKNRNVEDFSNKLLELLKDKEKRLRFGMRARELVREIYPKERLIKDMKNLYQECLK